MPPPHEGLIAVVGENVQPQPGADFRQVVTGGPRPIASGPTDADCHFKLRHSASSLYASGNNIRRIILRYCCRGKGRVLVRASARMRTAIGQYGRSVALIYLIDQNGV